MDWLLGSFRFFFRPNLAQFTTRIGVYVVLFVCLSYDNFQFSNSLTCRKFIFIFVCEYIFLECVYQGHRVKIKVTWANIARTRVVRLLFKGSLVLLRSLSWVQQIHKMIAATKRKEMYVDSRWTKCRRWYAVGKERQLKRMGAEKTKSSTYSSILSWLLIADKKRSIYSICRFNQVDVTVWFSRALPMYSI